MNGRSPDHRTGLLPLFNIQKSEGATAMEKSQKDKFAELAQMLRSVDTDSFTIMAQNLKVLLIILDQDLKLQYGNDVFFEMVGWQPEKVIGQDYVHNFIPPEISFVVRTTLREIINKQVNNYSG